VKKSTWVNLHAALRMSCLSAALILSLFGGLTSRAVTSAASLQCSPRLQSCNSSPSPTPTFTPSEAPLPSATPRPSPTPSATPSPSPTPRPSPTPTSTPILTPTPLPKRTPLPFPQIQPDPTTALLPVSTGTAGTPFPVPPASSTAVAGIVTSNQTVTERDPTPTNQPSQGRADQGTNLLLPSLGVGAPFLLLSGGLLWLLWRRQTSQHKSVLRARADNTRTSAWMSNSEIQTSFTPPEFGSSLALVPSVSVVSGNPPFETTEPMPSFQPAERPSDLFPMPIAVAQPMVTMALDNGLSSPPNGSFQLEVRDSLNLPFQPPTQARGSNKHGQVGVLVSPPMVQMENVLSPRGSALSETPGALVTIGPPAINDDLLLAKAMEQAQMGLFALPGRERSLQGSSFQM
jgi:hypothetical protein